MNEIKRICPKCGKELKSRIFDTVIDAGKGVVKIGIWAIREYAKTSSEASKDDIFTDNPLLDSLSSFANTPLDTTIECKNCGYVWTLYDTIKEIVASIHETVNQTRDYSHYIDNFAVLIKALEGYDKEDCKISALIQNYKEEMRNAWTPDRQGTCKYHFTIDKDYEDRKVIFIAKSIQDVAGYWDDTHSINYIFTHDCIPSDIKFPLGGPNVNTLYIANRVKSDEYLPYDNYELELFKDKKRELISLLCSLGATEITFTSLRGTTVEEAEREGFGVNAEAGWGAHKISGSYSEEERQNRMRSQGIKADLIHRLDPTDYPSLPKDLHWYYSDPDWKSIVDARLNHNQLHFEQSISTKRVNVLDTQSQLDVNAAYEGIVLKINTNYNRYSEFHVKTTEETEWRITAEFKPLSEFKNKTANVTGNEPDKQLPDGELKYLQELKDILEDGEISEGERRMLDLMRQNLGISEERATELEASLNFPQLTEKEQEYLEMYREYLDKGGGVITEKQRRRLVNYADNLNLSSDRVAELEKL